MAEKHARAVHVRVERIHDEVAVVTLDDPKTLNALGDELVAELREALRTLAADAAVRVVVLTGAGRGFCSGHAYDGLEQVGHRDASVQARLANQNAYSDLVLQINELPQIVIAAVNGPAAGGGLAIALAADLRLCSESARFNAAFIRVGVSGCDVGTSYLLPRIVGPTLAFEMMLTGRLIDAEEALRAGLVLDVVPDPELVATALRLADAVVANGRFAVAMTKRAMWAALDAASLRHAMLLEDRTQVMCLQSGEIEQAVAASRSRVRPADWRRSGR